VNYFAGVAGPPRVTDLTRGTFTTYTLDADEKVCGLVMIQGEVGPRAPHPVQAGASSIRNRLPSVSDDRSPAALRSEPGCILGRRTPAAAARWRSRRVAAWRSIRRPREFSRIALLARSPNSPIHSWWQRNQDDLAALAQDAKDPGGRVARVDRRCPGRSLRRSANPAARASSPARSRTRFVEVRAAVSIASNSG